jgi:hypothetical protein
VRVTSGYGTVRPLLLEDLDKPVPRGSGKEQKQSNGGTGDSLVLFVSPGTQLTLQWFHSTWLGTALGTKWTIVFRHRCGSRWSMAMVDSDGGHLGAQRTPLDLTPTPSDPTVCPVIHFPGTLLAQPSPYRSHHTQPESSDLRGKVTLASCEMHRWCCRYTLQCGNGAYNGAPFGLRRS